MTCADYGDESRRVAQLSAWMSGWFSQRSGSTVVNLDGYRRNVADVQRWCRSDPRRPVMTGHVDGGFRGQGRTTRVRPASTCRGSRYGQLLGAPAAMQDLVVPWMGGWSMTKNLTNVEIGYVDQNGRVIHSFCKSNRNVSLMRAFEQNQR